LRIRTDFFNLFLFASARCLTAAERWRSYPLKKLGGEIQGKTNKNPRHLFLILFFNTKQGGVSLSISFFFKENRNYKLLWMGQWVSIESLLPTVIRWWRSPIKIVNSSWVGKLGSSLAYVTPGAIFSRW
jgi:hypothetical protein